MTSAFGMGFGSQTTSAPAFGSTTGFNFGAAAAPASTTGFSFGNTPAPAANTTGFSFGNPAAPATSTTGFSFGQPVASAANTTGFSFGQTAAPASTTGFSFGGLGATTTTAPNTGFSFGGLGATATSVAPFSFSGAATTTAPTFGFGGFGSNAATTTASGFSFGQPSNALGGGGMFSAGQSLAPAGCLVQGAQNVDPVSNLITAVCNPTIYGDERDKILGRLNQIQAAWGVGKGFYSPNAPPVEFTPENPFCCFKATGYSLLPTSKVEDGLVGIVFNKKEQEILSQKQQVIDSLHRCFGSKPTISVIISSIKGLAEDRTEVVFSLLERLQTGLNRKVPPSEICNYLEQATVKPQLAQLGVMSLTPKTAPSKEQIQQYLDNPPAYIEPIVWNQAKLDNPNPEKLIPTPLIGFAELSRRMRCQEYETNQHQQRLDIISKDIVELNHNHSTTVAKIAEHKRKLLELQHRVLKVLVHQEINRKMGYAIQVDEEQLRIKLEAIQAELSAPTQFKGHLKELTSQIRMQNYQTSTFEGERYSMDEVSKEEMKEQLRSYQEGIVLLINVIKEDSMDLKTIEEIVKDNVSRRR